MGLDRAVGLARSRLRKLRDADALRWSVRKRLFERALQRVPVVHATGIEHLGTDYGGWYVPIGLVDEGWIVYSVGAGHDVSFDVEVLNRTGARVRAFDIMQRHLDDALKQADHHPRYSVYLIGVAASDGPLQVFGSPDPATGGAAAGPSNTGEMFEVAGRSIASLAADFGDLRVDLLKLDVEGGEYAILSALDLDALGVTILGVEFHPTVQTAIALAAIESVRSRGFDVVSRHGGDFVFCRRPTLN